MRLEIRRLTVTLTGLPGHGTPPVPMSTVAREEFSDARGLRQPYARAALEAEVLANEKLVQAGRRAGVAISGRGAGLQLRGLGMRATEPPALTDRITAYLSRQYEGPRKLRLPVTSTRELAVAVRTAVPGAEVLADTALRRIIEDWREDRHVTAADDRRVITPGAIAPVSGARVPPALPVPESGRPSPLSSRLSGLARVLGRIPTSVALGDPRAMELKAGPGGLRLSHESPGLKLSAGMGWDRALGAGATAGDLKFTASADVLGGRGQKLAFGLQYGPDAPDLAALPRAFQPAGAYAGHALVNLPRFVSYLRDGGVEELKAIPDAVEQAKRIAGERDRQIPITFGLTAEVNREGQGPPGVSVMGNLTLAWDVLKSKAGADPGSATSVAVPRGGGQPLDTKVLERLEGFFGRKLPQVRIHTGPAAEAAAAGLKAEAFTLGRDIYFGPGKFAPESKQGLGLLGHELTHVIQQEREEPGKVQRGGGDTGALEREAEKIAQAIVTASGAMESGALVIANYRRAYRPVDGQPLNEAERATLDMIAARGLEACERILRSEHPTMLAENQTLPRLRMSLDVELDATSPDLAAHAWGRRMADTIVRAAEGGIARPPVLLSAPAGTLALRPDRARQRQPAGERAADEAPRADELIAAKFPYLAGVLDAKQLKVVQRYTDWLYNNGRINERVAEYKKKARERAIREGKTLSYQYTSDYVKGLERAGRGDTDRPEELTIQIDTGKLLDRGILEEQPWNVQAEKEFREKWVMHLMSKPTVLDLRTARNLEDVGTLYWAGGEGSFALPHEGGRVTWKALMDWSPFALAYYKEVKNSPLIQAVDDNLKLLEKAYETAEADFEMELERKGEYPKSAWVAEKLGSEIDWNAAEHLLPKGKSFADMDPWEVMRFLGSLTPEQMDRITRVLPGDKEWRKVRNHLMNVSMAGAQGKYEAALLTMPLVADELERLVWKTQSYIQRTVEGASTAVAILQTVQVGCKIALTVMGGVAGKGYGLVGIGAGSAGGAAGSEMLFEAGRQYGEGKFDPGAILWKGGKEGVVTFITALIGGGLASKFQKLLGLRMARLVPWEGARMFLIGRMADATSGVVESGVEVVVEGMLEGKWPESMDDLLDKVAENVVVEVTIGGALDVVTGVPNLKGQAWDALFGSGSEGGGGGGGRGGEGGQSGGPDSSRWAQRGARLEQPAAKGPAVAVGEYWPEGSETPVKLSYKSGQKGQRPPRSDLTSPDRHVLGEPEPGPDQHRGVPKNMTPAEREAWLKSQKAEGHHPGPRSHDAEAKLFEDVLGRTGPSDKGEVHFKVNYPPCPACQDVVHRFRALRPGIQVIQHSAAPAPMASGSL